MKIRPVGGKFVSYGQTGGETRRDEANSRFS